MITPLRITEFPGCTMAGMSQLFSVNDMNPASVWQQFMPRVKTLNSMRSNHDLYAVQEYPEISGERQDITPATVKFWAAVSITPGVNTIAEPFQILEVPAGTYAVFLHKGTAAAIAQTMNDIFGTWMPNSGYVPDGRPHFQVMTPQYKGPQDPEAEEEVWIPIRRLHAASNG